MRATINVEFTDEELKKYAADVARRVGLNFIHDVMQHARGFKIPPGFLEMLVQAFSDGVKRGEKFPDDSKPASPFTPSERCARVESAPSCPEGWACCACSVYNVLDQVTCRNCGHLRCDVPPPPDVASA